MVAFVLLQVGKGSNMGAFLGGGSSQTIFGPSGPGTFMGKLTAGVAVLFMLTSLLLAHPSFNKPQQAQKQTPIIIDTSSPQQQTPPPVLPTP